MEGVARLKLDSNRSDYIVVGPGDSERGSRARLASQTGPPPLG